MLRFDHFKRSSSAAAIGARCALLCLCGLDLIALGAPAFAQEKEAPTAGATSPQDQEAAPDQEGSISSSVPALAKIKKGLLDKGINLQLNYTGEVLGNPSGGIRRGAIYEGLFDFGFDADMEKVAGIKGGTIHINAFQIHGRGLSEYNLDNFGTVSGIEARATTRLYEAFYEQKLLDDKLSIRAGNLAEESDFFISDFAANFVNGTFGWPAVWDQNLPSGGASYPLATPGIRVRYDANPHLALLVGLYDGDPTGAGFVDDPQRLDPHGTNFRVNDPPLVLAEAQYRYNQEKTSTGLAGTVRLGGWYHFGRFGQTLAPSDDSAGSYAPYRGDFGLYGILDQMIYRLPGDDPKKGVGVFLRLAGSPSDRNLLDFYTDAGINFAGLVPNRPDDVFGFAAYYAHVSSVATALDQQAAITSGAGLPVRTGEFGFELSYQYQVLPGLVVQPDFQYIIRPGGGMADASLGITTRIPDAAVFGLRTTIKF